MYNSITHSIVLYVQCVFSKLEMLQLSLYSLKLQYMMYHFQYIDC